MIIVSRNDFKKIVTPQPDEAGHVGVTAKVRLRVPMPGHDDCFWSVPVETPGVWYAQESDVDRLEDLFQSECLELEKILGVLGVGIAENARAASTAPEGGTS